MANSSNENIYLLEFLVNDLNIDGGGKCNCVDSAGELCISFQFLDNQLLQLCEHDFSPDKKFSSDTTRIGKSCIFSLTPDRAQEAQEDFNISIFIATYKDDPEGKIIGEAVVPIADMMKDLLQKGECGPVAKVLENQYPVTNTDNVKIGDIFVYIRLSCYGKMIITQFQMNMDDKTVLFKDKEGRSLYRYKKKKGSKMTKIEDMQKEEKKKSATPQSAPFQSAPPQNASPQSEPPQNARPQSAPPSAFPQNPNCPSQPCYPDGLPPNFNGPPLCATNVPPPTSAGQPWGYPPLPSQDPGCSAPPCFPNGTPPDLSRMPPNRGAPFESRGVDFPPYVLGTSGYGSAVPPTTNRCTPFESGFASSPPPYVTDSPGAPMDPYGGDPNQPPAQDFNMFYSPTLTQQAGTFPLGTYEQQMAQKMTRFSISSPVPEARAKSCLAPCSRR